MGNPSPCSELPRSFLSSLCWISAGLIPIPDTHRSGHAGLAYLLLSLPALAAACLLGTQPFLFFWDAGRERQGGWSDSPRRQKDCACFSHSLCMAATHILWLSQSKQPRKRRESPQARHVVFKITKNRDLCHFLNIQTPNLLS